MGGRTPRLVFPACLANPLFNVTITFRQLAKKLKKTDKSVHCMLGPHGNPHVDIIPEIIMILQANEQVNGRAGGEKPCCVSEWLLRYYE